MQQNNMSEQAAPHRKHQASNGSSPAETQAGRCTSHITGGHHGLGARVTGGKAALVVLMVVVVDVVTSEQLVTVVAVRRGRLGRRVPAAVVLPGQLHVDHGVGEAVVGAERHDAVVEALHDGSLRGVELLRRPQAAAPRGAVRLRRLLRVLGELVGHDERGEDNDFGLYSVDMELGLAGPVRLLLWRDW